MKEFNRLCREFEEMDPETYFVMLGDLSADIIPALHVIAFDGMTGVEAFSRFILGAIVSDGKLSEEEYELMAPMLDRFFGTEIDFDSAKTLLKENETLNDLKLRAEDKLGLDEEGVAFLSDYEALQYGGRTDIGRMEERLEANEKLLFETLRKKSRVRCTVFRLIYG